MEELQPLPQILASCGSGRRRSGDCNSPEFEFWMVSNPSFPQPNLLSADQLFSGGVLLPLQHLNLKLNEPPPPEPDASGSGRIPDPDSNASESAETPVPNAASTATSKRWRDIFRKSDKKINDDRGVKERDNFVKERRREKKNIVGGGATTSAAELNINIWPFSRSRSAGNSGARPRAAATRKVSSAPCSRSNSRGESKARKWPSSPSRAGVHLGRSSPVWQVRRGGAAATSVEKSMKRDANESRRRVPVAGGSKARVLSLNVPVCMGYRQHFSCRSDENSRGGVAAAVTIAGGEGVRGSNLFNIRSLFTKKVY